MLSLNRAQILGNTTKDAEMRYTPNGQAVTSFSVATNRKWKGRDGGEGGEAVEYHDVVVWGQQAENVTPMLRKGTPVYVEGRIQTRNWEGQDGVKRYKTEIVAEMVNVLGNRGGGSYGESKPASPAIDSEVAQSRGAGGSENPVEKIASESEVADPKKAEKAEKTEDEIDIDEIPF